MKGLMTNFEPKHFLTHLPMPSNDLARLSFCSGNKTGKVKEWVESLHATQISQTSATLYRSIPELIRLKTDPKTRFEMLEALRPSLHHCLQGLSKDFLNQPVVLPEPAHKTAVIAQALQKHMVDGYVACARDIVVQNKLKAQTLEMLATALNRAMTGIGQIILRSYQLYTYPPGSLWRLAHNLHRTACFYELQKRPVADKVLSDMPASTVENAYIRILLLATAGTNQLGQKDMGQVYAALARWCSMVRLLASGGRDRQNQFVVNQSHEQPPENKARFSGSEEDYLLELDLKALLDQLNRQKGTTEDIIAAKSAGDQTRLPGSLVSHLLRRWGGAMERKMERRPVQNAADVCIGLVDCHYFVSGGIKFEDFIHQGNDDSAWQNNPGRSFSAGLTPVDSKATGQDYAKPTYQVTVQNISAGGYCLLWKGDMPTRVEAGELVGIKEAGRKSWNLGVVRWVKQLKQASQLGIQLLSNHPSASGIAQIYDMGGFSDYMRAILLPPSKFGEIPATILTAKAPFQDMTKAKLLSDHKATTIKLDRCLFSTGSIKQFSYHSLDATEKSESPGGRGRSFSSSWEDR